MNAALRRSRCGSGFISNMILVTGFTVIIIFVSFGSSSSYSIYRWQACGHSSYRWTCATRPTRDSLSSAFVNENRYATDLKSTGSHLQINTILYNSWLPPFHDSSTSSDLEVLLKQRQEIEIESIELLAFLIRQRLKHSNDFHSTSSPFTSSPIVQRAIYLVQGKFRDLACDVRGEINMESLFQEIPNYLDPSKAMTRKYFSSATFLQDDDCGVIDTTNASPSLFFDRVIRGAVLALQSLTLLGSQVGVKGTPEQLQKLTDHLEPSSLSSRQQSTSAKYNSHSFHLDDPTWDHDCIRRLKYHVDVTAGTQLLATLKKKRSAQGAFDLLVQLGCWTKHEDVALIRSGFPIRFTKEEEEAAVQATYSTHDPDSTLGIRKDFRDMKVYTIDRSSTMDIDDGLSIQRIKRPADGKETYKIWIHIADADRWSPRDSDIFHVAQKRITSIYLPTGSVPMFPPLLSNQIMALRANQDSHALSLGVELNDDGSIILSSIEITPSLVHVDYRLSYVEVDEMLEQGMAYFEEWEIGALLNEANKRRKYRMSNGSSESFVPKPIPQAEIVVIPDEKAEDNLEIQIDIEVSHNAGLNHSSLVSVTDKHTSLVDYCSPLSPAFLLVTEMMVLAGEALGQWAKQEQKQNVNKLSLPYRSQSRPDYAQRQAEFDTLEALRNIGHGYCHAWYARRFFESVRVSDRILPHYGLGLETYVQWTSPIRRFTDLQVHAAVKRHLRISRLSQMLTDKIDIPESLRDSDLGFHLQDFRQLRLIPNRTASDFEINFDKGSGFLNAAKVIQRKSKEYWLFEYIRRQGAQLVNPQYEAVVLGCTDPRRLQYAIYIHKLGLEHKYISEKGQLQIGESIWLDVSSVSPRQGLLTFKLGRRSSGKA